MRLFLISVMLIALCLGLGGYALLQSPERLLRAAEWAVDTFTPLDLELRGVEVDRAENRLRAGEIHLQQDASDGAPLVSITGFEAVGPLGDLLVRRLRHTRLKADSVIVYVAEGDSAEDPSPSHWMRYLRWLPQSLDVGQLHVVSSGEATWVVPLKQIAGERLDEGKYRLRAAADYEGEPLEVTLYLYAMRSASGFRGVQMRGEFYATQSSRLAIAEGELRGGVEAFSYDFSLNMAFPDVRSVLAHFREAPQVEGNLQVRGRVQGDASGFELSNAEFRLAKPAQYEFTARGHFDYRGPDNNHLELDAEGQMNDLGYLLDWVALDLSSLGTARAQLAMQGSLGRLAVERFELSTRHAAGLQVDVAGSLAPGALSGKPTPGDNRVNVTLKGPRLAVLSQWLGEPPFEPGPWELSGVITGDGEALQATQLEAMLGAPDATVIRASGQVGRIALARPITAASVSGVDVQLRGEAPSLEQLNTWLALSLPPEHELRASAHLSGEGNHLVLDQGTARLQGSDLQFTLSDLGGQVIRDGSWRVESASGKAALNLSDTSALSQYADVAMPVLGAVEATATLAQDGQRFQLHKLQVTIDSEQLYLRASGRIDDLARLRGTALDIQFSRLDTRNLVHTLRSGFQYDRPLGSLSGSGRLVQAGEQWNLAQIAVNNTADSGFTLSLAGDIQDLSGLPRGDVTLNTNITNRALLEAVTGRPLPPLSATLRSRSQPGLVQVEGGATLGQTHWQAHGEARHADGALAGLKLVLESPHVYLADLGLGNMGLGNNGNSDGEAEAGPDHPLESLIAGLPDYPLELGLHLDGLSGEQIQVRSLDLDIQGENRQYLLRTLNIDYQEAVAEIRGIIDLKARPAAISLGGQALAINLRHLVKDLGINSDIQGVLNLRGGVSARGARAEDWLRSLDGNVALALEDAVIEGAAYDVLATDLLAWLYSGAALEKSTYVQCTMAQFALKSGVATTDSLFVESPRMVASGQGTLDFVRGKLDVTLVPRSKNRLLQIPSSVTLHGDMTKPKTRVSPIMATADASAEALMLIPNLTLKLFGVKLGKEAAARPCEASLGN